MNKRLEESQPIEQNLFELIVGESMLLVENNWNNTFRMSWHVTRVPNGWIFIEDSQADRVPVSVFVPLTTYSNPNP